ncbi:O-antigen polymerase [Acinetobacter baumannii]|uniref:O-antigen polymerase n=1 Tax=Acinetobacter baumannii TaxID=470 RepID=UPI000D69601C|nr:O-antigen polymerase [Acinetobacter baumannii]MCP9173289.1 oligosaccharide repeat unit polymerase [Acinetobacter baumannii]MDN8432317.1 O-antigen polymerase [Acinetobacter baumannii]TWO65462.1 oligosaccharide repeat unit polymerase [Acinetobacter baumannii]HEN9540378.1 oligosaccharide repeat unit polymerase [Acinetobacter baumannii]HEN9598013.1 oligosaccharide repeat unit polymerase [Acinetobacter baumannii]
MILYRNNIVFGVFLSIVFLSLIFLINLKLDFVGFTFFINVLSCVFFLTISLKKNISTLLFFYIFNLLFLALIPWFHYTNDSIIWALYSFSEDNYIKANFLIFFFNLFIYLFYQVSPLLFKNKLFIQDKEPNFLISLALCGVSFSIIFYALDFNLMKVFFRGVEGDVYEEGNANPVLAIFVMLSRLLPAFILMRYIVFKKYYKSFIIFIFVLLCDFPTGIARFMVAFVYLPLLLCIVPSLKRSIRISLFIILGMVFIFPFLNQFRYFSFDQKISLIPDLSFFSQGHFDAYQNFMEVLRLDFITYGYQLLGVFLFFIPRSFWPDKPVGSGYQMAIDNNYAFNNISMPFIAEGYINFGYFGILLFAGVLGFFMRQIDLKFLKDSYSGSFSYCKGVFLCAAIFFMLRGDLMSSFSFLVSGIIAFLIAEKI